MGKVIYFREELVRRRKMLTVFDVAKYIIEKDLPNMTHKKLQKLCYYAQAWHLALAGKRLMDCDFQAWVHGPVCRELYDCCKFDINKAKAIAGQNTVLEEDKKFMDIILAMYGKHTGLDLELLTHSEQPWKEARKGLHYWESSSNVISDDLMAKYYLEELTVATQEEEQ